MAASDFYAERDNRTIACVGGTKFERARVVLSIDSAEAESLSGQVAFLLAANLLARWCRHIRFQAPITKLHPLAHSALAATHDYLGECAASIACLADNHGDFQTGSSFTGPCLRLHVGRDAAPGGYRIVGDGWLALGGDGVSASPAGHHSTVIGAVLAACVGCALTFRAALGDLTAYRPIRLSLWNLRGGAAAKEGPPVGYGALGRACLIGCGAVGSAIAYVTPLVGLRGVFSLVDSESVEVSNLNRSPLFVVKDVGRRKVDVVAEYLERNESKAQPIAEWFDDAVREHQLFMSRPDLVIPTANERNVRHSIQHQVPPLQVYGTTGRNWDAFLGRHIPLQEDCLACRFPRGDLSEPPLACSTGSVQTENRLGETSPDAALPFLSTAAAALAVAELLKVTNAEDYPCNPNLACLDFRGDLAGFAFDQRSAAPSCICDSQRPVWLSLNQRSRFASCSLRTLPQ